MDIRRSVSTVEVIDLLVLKRENWGEGEVKAGRGGGNQVLIIICTKIFLEPSLKKYYFQALQFSAI